MHGRAGAMARRAGSLVENRSVKEVELLRRVKILVQPRESQLRPSFPGTSNVRDWRKKLRIRQPRVLESTKLASHQRKEPDSLQSGWNGLRDSWPSVQFSREVLHGKFRGGELVVEGFGDRNLRTMRD